MRLMVHLVLRFIGVVLLCLACAVGWILIDTHRAIERETVASADRAALALRSLYWQELVWRDGILMKGLIPLPEWQSLATLRIVSPGICITFAPGREEPRQLCTQTDTVGTAAPAWFAAADDALFGPYPTVARPLTARQASAGTIVAAADPVAARRVVWQQLSILAGVAAAMSVGIALLAALAIGHALLPARAIIAGLKRCETGDYAHCLPRFRAREFRHIARAVNDLAGRLARTTADRLRLTQRLFEVQESERRALARDLHDEFGQCLTATAALAAAIEAGAGERPELAEDARAIARTTAQMMTSLRGALVRLRSQDLEELGLQVSLAQLVAGWNTRSAPSAVFHLDVAGDLASVPDDIAVNLYRIAQECLTNAARHGRPSDVRLRVERLAAAGEAVALTVEDDGGGAPAAIEGAAGHGILGIRERVAALGGKLSIEPAMRGLRIAAIIPLLAPRAAANCA